MRLTRVVRTQKMIKYLHKWYNGKDVRVNPNESEEWGGIGLIHETYKEYHWSAKAARSLVTFYLMNWQWIFGTAITAVTVYISILSLK